MKPCILLALSAGLLVASQAQAQEPPAALPPADRLVQYQALVRDAAGETPPREDDSPGRIQSLLRSDLDDRRFFNRPGATRTEFLTEWEECRQIARRLAQSRSETAPQFSSGAGGLGGIIGAAIGSAINDGIARRRAAQDLRRHCLNTRGWRLVLPEAQHRRRIARMPSEERMAYLDLMIGAPEVPEALIFDALAPVEPKPAPAE